MKSPFEIDIIKERVTVCNNYQEPIEKAAESFTTWSQTAAETRSSILSECARLLRENNNELSYLISQEMGKPLRESRGEVEYSAKYFAWFAGEAQRIYGRAHSINNKKELIVRKFPIGICGMITPWNFPLAMLARKTAAALAAGCTILSKPSSETPYIAYALGEILNKAKLPADVFNVITGETEKIVSAWMDDERVRKISFTGSTEVGKKLIMQSANTVKMLTLELGGNAPCIVFSDCDLENAVTSVMHAKFRNAGQTCVSINRIFVQQDIYDKFAAKLIEKVSLLKVGSFSDESIDIGELVNLTAVTKVKNLVEEAVKAGAKLKFGVIPDGKSLLVPPIVLTNVTPSMKLFGCEIFGPVCALIPFSTDEEVLSLANDTIFGLAAYVFTKNLDRYHSFVSKLEYGMIGFNEANISEVAAPFGGIKQSGYGREGGSEGIEEYLRLQYVAVSTS